MADFLLEFVIEFAVGIVEILLDPLFEKAGRCFRTWKRSRKN